MAGARPRARGWRSSARGHRSGSRGSPGAGASTGFGGSGGTAGRRPRAGRRRWGGGGGRRAARQDHHDGGGHGGGGGRRAGAYGGRRGPRRPGGGGGVGLAADADVRIVTPELAERGSAARIELPNGGAVRLALQVPGLHNLRNATAALAAALELGVDLERCVTALERFSGVARRFERVGEARGVMIVDDYAHHPTEVLATLAAARQTFPRRRVVAVFQPHLFSRTALHGEALGRALASADVVVVAPIYGAREQPLPGVTADLVAQGAARAGAATVAVRDRAALVDSVAERVRPGDVVFTLGAGDVTRVGPELLRQLGGAEQP